MSTDVGMLERRATELMKQSDFGPDAVRVNSEIIEQAPKNEAAWTRLGRCYLEQRQFDDAVVALRSALAINPSSGIATNLLTEVRRRRALTPTAAERVTTGFSTREFAALETLAPDEAKGALGSRIEALFEAINASTIAEKIVEARRREGETGSKLFHANSFHSNGTGHIFAFHHGGRWEPQFNIGWFSSPPLPARCVRIGLGFNLSQAGRDPERVAGQERILASFDRFQLTLERAWKRELARWMAASGGFIQYGDHPPALDLQPEQAVDWLLKCRHAAAHEWIFVGRWLFLDDPDDARVLGDRAKLANAVDDTFRTLFPLWLSAYTGSAGDTAPAIAP
jgi:tetratricopeptide (TPR) repeat protein